MPLYVWRLVRGNGGNATRAFFCPPFFLLRCGEKMRAARRLVEGTDDVVSDVPPIQVGVGMDTKRWERKREKNRGSERVQNTYTHGKPPTSTPNIGGGVRIGWKYHYIGKPVEPWSSKRVEETGGETGKRGRKKSDGERLWTYRRWKGREIQTASLESLKRRKIAEPDMVTSALNCLRWWFLLTLSYKNRWWFHVT